LINSVSWNFGDGGTSTILNPSHTYANSGVYLPCLSITGFVPGTTTPITCTTCDSILVNNPSGPCNASFTSTMLSSNSLSFTNTSSGAGTLLSTVWNFGDGQSVEGAATMSHVYKNAGNYNVSLTINEDICIDELAQTLTLVSDKFRSNNEPFVTRNNDQFIVNFNFETTTAVSIQLVDALGKELTSSINKTVSTDKVVLNTNHLSEGVYFVNIKFNGRVQTTKMIK